LALALLVLDYLLVKLLLPEEWYRLVLCLA
jgi:hypothetical protein